MSVIYTILKQILYKALIKHCYLHNRYTLRDNAALQGGEHLKKKRFVMLKPIPPFPNLTTLIRTQVCVFFAHKLRITFVL